MEAEERQIDHVQRLVGLSILADIEAAAAAAASTTCSLENAGRSCSLCLTDLRSGLLGDRGSSVGTWAGALVHLNMAWA